MWVIEEINKEEITEKLTESIEPSKFATHRARMSVQSESLRVCDISKTCTAG